MITLFGLKNCDSCKKAQKWCEAQGLTAKIHDLRADGLDRQRLQRWLAACGVDVLINKRGTSYRKLSEKERAALSQADTALNLTLANVALIKRPVVEVGDDVFVGFTDALKAKLA